MFFFPCGSQWREMKSVLIDEDMSKQRKWKSVGTKLWRGRPFLRFATNAALRWNKLLPLHKKTYFPPGRLNVERTFRVVDVGCTVIASVRDKRTRVRFVSHTWLWLRKLICWTKTRGVGCVWQSRTRLTAQVWRMWGTGQAHEHQGRAAIVHLGILGEVVLAVAGSALTRPETKDKSVVAFLRFISIAPIETISGMQQAHVCSLSKPIRPLPRGLYLQLL